MDWLSWTLEPPPHVEDNNRLFGLLFLGDKRQQLFLPLGQIHESFLELGVLILKILYGLFEGHFSVEINSEKMRNLYEKPVMK